MDQHVISAFLLRAFARVQDQRHMLAAFDKQTGAVASIDVREFLTERDAHPAGIEDEFNRTETDAARALFRLRKSMRQVPPGMYAVGAERVLDGPAVEDVGIHRGMHLHVGRHQIEALPAPEHDALLAFVALMYQRAPGVEASILEFGRIYDAAVHRSLEEILPGFKVDLSTELANYRKRISSRTFTIAAKLRPASWWLVRPEPPDHFVLGDSPVVATISLGDDDQWRAILSGETYVVAMPLAPDLALLLAPQVLMPVTLEPGLAPITDAVNHLSWRQAGRFVVARDPAHLDAAWPAARDPDRRRSTTSPPVDAEYIARKARTDTGRIVSMTQFKVAERVGWRRWKDCRLEFGFIPYAAGDRDHAGQPPCPGWRQRAAPG